MLSLSRISYVLGPVLVLLLVLTGCLGERPGANAEVINPGVEGAIYDGVIIFFEELPEAGFDLVPVELRDLYQEVDVFANMHFMDTRRLSFERVGGYVTFFVQPGDRVYEGDLVAFLSFEDEEFIMHRRLAEIRLQQFDRDFLQDLMEREIELEAARQRMYTASAQDFPAASMAVQLMETELEIFRHGRMTAREAVFDALYEYDRIIAGENLYSPINGIVERMVRDGLYIDNPSSVITIVDDTSFVFILEADGRTMGLLPPHVSRDAVMRFGDVIFLESTATWTDLYGERRPFLELEVINISDAQAGGWTGLAVHSTARPVDVASFFEAVYEIAPNTVNMPIASTFRGTMFFDLARDAMVIPRAALRIGEGGAYTWQTVDGRMVQVPVAGAHYVLVYIDGELRQRHLVMGIVRPQYAQVISGLEPDSLVVVDR